MTRSTTIVLFALAFTASTRTVQAKAADSLSDVERGVVLVISDDWQVTHDVAGGAVVVHAMASDESTANRFRELVHQAGMGGRVIASVLPADGHLPHPDRFVNQLIVDHDGGKQLPQSSELDRVLSIRGTVKTRREGKWSMTAAKPDPLVDGWFAHWYDASGNCVSHDKRAGVPTTVQWQHGPAFEDGTADGKIPRIADGRALYFDNLSQDLVCRDAGNGLLLWRRHVGVGQKSDIVLADGEAYLWCDPDIKATDRRGDRELGYLCAIDMATGQTTTVLDQGVRAGSAPGIELPWNGRTRTYHPVPWFVVSTGLENNVVVQAYGQDLVVLNRETGNLAWSHKLEPGVTWFSPTVSGGLVIAAEAVVPARRERNNGSDHVRALTAFDSSTGEQVWRNVKVHPLRQFHDKNGKPFTGRASFKTLSAADDLLLVHISSYQFREGGSIAVLDIKTGVERWRRTFEPGELYTQGSQRPVIRGGEVVMLDGTGIYRYSAATGSPLGEPIKRPKNLRRTGRSNSACTASRATDHWLMANAWLYVGPDGEARICQGVRGACGQGVIPANGLTYVPPTPCDCGDYLRGYQAFPAKVTGRPVLDDQRLVTGVAAPRPEAFSAPWPTYLGSSVRTSYTRMPLNESLDRKWSNALVAANTDALTQDRRDSERYLGSISAAVIGDGVVVVSALERHEIIAVEEATGAVRWRYFTGGKVDSPPTLASGMAVFGCDDGHVYAVRLADGELVWRFCAAPTDGLAMLHGHLASAYPVPGSVLVLGNTVIAVAGVHTDVGGLHVWALDLLRGTPTARRLLSTDLPPALSNNLAVADADGRGFWIVSPPGGSYGGGGGYHLSLGLQDIPYTDSMPGPAMSFDRNGSRVRFRTESGRGGSTHGWKGAMRAGGFHRLSGHRVAVGDDIGLGLNDPTGRAPNTVWAYFDRGRNAQPQWQLSRTELNDVESLGALALAGDQIIVAGGKRDGSKGRLFVIDRKGSVVRERTLAARVTECGLACANGSIYVSCEDGSLHRFGNGHTTNDR